MARSKQTVTLSVSSRDEVASRTRRALAGESRGDATPAGVRFGYDAVHVDFTLDAA